MNTVRQAAATVAGAVLPFNTNTNGCHAHRLRVTPPNFINNYNKLDDISHNSGTSHDTLNTGDKAAGSLSADAAGRANADENGQGKDTCGKDTLYIVMPAYNEEANIEQVVSKWYPLLANGSEESRLVIADSGSSDKTHLILESLQQNFPKIVLLSDTIRYHGPKVIALYNYAIESGADYVFQTDSDDQTRPEDFASFWQDRQQYDAIFGLRRVRGDGRVRGFVEKVVCLLVLCFFGVHVPDANAPFRLMKCSELKQYMSAFSPDYNLPNILITTFFVFYRHRVCFREISFRPRMAGTNSINVKRIILIGIGALRDFARFRRWMRMRKS